MALLICDEQPAMSFCDIEDFADVNSCMAMVLFSPSAIFITAASALANPSSVQVAVFDLANTGDAARTAVAIKAALNDLEIMSALHEGIIAFFRNAPCQVKFLCSHRTTRSTIPPGRSRRRRRIIPRLEQGEQTQLIEAGLGRALLESRQIAVSTTAR
jgi:hypothetical protein